MNYELQIILYLCTVKLKKTMEKIHDLTLMKARSYRSVLAEGYRLYNGNFRKLFKCSWLVALVYALCCGALGTLTSIRMPELTVLMMQQMAGNQPLDPEPLRQMQISLIQIIGLILLAIAALSLASATILNKLKEHKDTGKILTPAYWLTTSPAMMGRSLKGTFLTLLVAVIPLLLFIGTVALADTLSPHYVMRHIKTLTGAFIVCSAVVLAFVLPLLYVLMKYLMEAPCGYWRTLATGFGRGLRHWGLLFLVFFVSALLVELLAIVVMMPTYILNFANQQARQGLLIGDPLGMPDYMTALTFVTITLCCYLQFYVSQVMLVHNYYIYGSIETKEYEKDTIH